MTTVMGACPFPLMSFPAYDYGNGSLSFPAFFPAFTEGGVKINQTLRADSTYEDPVGPLFAQESPSPQFSDQWHDMLIDGELNPTGTNWMEAAVPLLTIEAIDQLGSGVPGNADTGVEIDWTWQLNPAVENRTVHLEIPDIVNISWPEE